MKSESEIQKTGEKRKREKNRKMKHFKEIKTWDQAKYEGKERKKVWEN